MDLLESKSGYGSFEKKKTATRSIFFTFHSGCWDKKKLLESLSGVRKTHFEDTSRLKASFAEGSWQQCCASAERIVQNFRVTFLVNELMSYSFLKSVPCDPWLNAAMKQPDSNNVTTEQVHFFFFFNELPSSLSATRLNCERMNRLLTAPARKINQAQE